MATKEVTIYDIAKQLNISSTTVSRALNDHPAVNVKTKRRITELAKKLGYRSNRFASNLRNQRTNTIGVIIPKIDSLFMSSVISGIEEVANNAGYNLIISQSFESEEKEKKNTATMFNSRVDGLIVSLSSETNNFDHFQEFTKKKIPLVFFDRVIEESHYTKVVIDNFKAGYDATTHLIEQGCRDILHITGSLNRNVYQDRFAGYQKALSDNGIPFETEMLITDSLSEAEINTCLVEKILKRGQLPDGIFITNDFSAAFIITALKKENISVPDDIAVIGFNNDLIAKVTEPTISTILYPGKEMGESVARLLINHLAGHGGLDIATTVVLNTELIIRKSSLKNNPPPAKNTIPK